MTEELTPIQLPAHEGRYFEALCLWAQREVDHLVIVHPEKSRIGYVRYVHHTGHGKVEERIEHTTIVFQAESPELAAKGLLQTIADTIANGDYPKIVWRAFPHYSVNGQFVRRYTVRCRLAFISREMVEDNIPLIVEPEGDG